MSKGIVIYQQEYQEKDLLLHVLFKEGKKSIQARGVLKIDSKNAGSLQLFSLSDFELFHEFKGISKLKSANMINSYPAIRNDLLKQAIATYFCECIDKSEISDFDLLVTALDLLCHNSYVALCYFQASLNSLLGIGAYVDGCVNCGSIKQIVTIDVEKGGFLCRNCWHDQMVDIHLLKQFRIYSKANQANTKILLQQEQASFELFKWFYRFFQDYSGILIRSYQFLETVNNISDI